MLRLVLFDILRLMRPSAATLRRSSLAGLRRMPAEIRVDMGCGGDLLITHALARAEAQLARRHQKDRDVLLTILSAIAVARGFGPVEWEDGDA